MKKRDEILTELQVELIKAIVGQTIVDIGDKLRYTGSHTFNNINDIPSVGYVQSQLGSGITSVSFDENDLGADGIGGYYLSFPLSAGNAIVAILVEFTAGGGVIMAPNFDFANNAILGFASDAPQTITVWTTGANITPPVTPAPVFSLQPIAQTVLQGQTLTLTVASSDTTSYQWYKDGLALAGQTSATLTVTNFNASKAGNYYAQAIGMGGVTNSNTVAIANDVGVIVSNQTALDLDGGTHIPITLTVTDGTDVANISGGQNVRMRSGVTVTVSGYGTTKLTSQDGLGSNTNLSASSQAFNPPINSPLDIYHRIPGSGTCYTIELPDSEVTQGGEDLYIGIKRPNESPISQPYYTYPSSIDTPTVGYTSFYVCSETMPNFKYGSMGISIVPAGSTVISGGSCDIDSECTL